MPVSVPTSATLVVDPAGPQPVAANRRTRARLRDLCDEVLASFRIAHDRELITDRDRLDARVVLAGLTPQARS